MKTMKAMKTAMLAGLMVSVFGLVGCGQNPVLPPLGAVPAGVAQPAPAGVPLLPATQPVTTTVAGALPGAGQVAAVPGVPAAATPVAGAVPAAPANTQQGILAQIQANEQQLIAAEQAVQTAGRAYDAAYYNPAADAQTVQNAEAALQAAENQLYQLELQRDQLEFALAQAPRA
jgi:hypothetical protein